MESLGTYQLPAAVPKYQRKIWSDAEFHLLRALSLLSYPRKAMQTALNRDGCLIFSKLQKHKKTLEHVEAQIQRALHQQNTPLVNVDNHQRNSFQKTQKYFCATLELWQGIEVTARDKAFTGHGEVRECVGRYVPVFLREMSAHDLQVLISRGLTREQAKETLNCIRAEALAHPRDQSQPKLEGRREETTARK